MHKGLSEPHILLASSNPQRLMRNLSGILTVKQLEKIQKEVDNNVVGLFNLGDSHYQFAIKINPSEWRQRVSRLYYAAYNVKRAVQLSDSGMFATDVSDHNRIDELPSKLTNYLVYKSKLKNMRDDRNLADYSHTAKESDLLISVVDMQILVGNFISDAKDFLAMNGVRV